MCHQEHAIQFVHQHVNGLTRAFTTRTLNYEIANRISRALLAETKTNSYMEKEKKKKEQEEIAYWVEHKKRNSAVLKMAPPEQQEHNRLRQKLYNKYKLNYRKMT